MEAMAPNEKVDPSNITLADVDRMIADNDEARKRLLATRKHLVVMEQAKAAAAASLEGAIGGKVIPLAAARGRRARETAEVEAGLPASGTVDSQLFEAISPLPLTADKLVQTLRMSEKDVAERLEDLERKKIIGHFDIEKRKPTKHRGVSAPVIERYFFWRPRSELSPKVRRVIFKGLLMRQWLSNHDLVLAAGARTPTEKRDVDNMLRALRRAENIWHKRGESGDWLYWMREDGGEPPDELDGRDWNVEKSVHGRRDPKRAAQKLKAAAAAGHGVDRDDDED